MRRSLRRGRGSVYSETLLLSHGDASYSAMTKLSRKVFYSAAATSLFGHDDANSKRLLLGCGDVSNSAMTMPT